MLIKGGTFGPVATNTYVVATGVGGQAWIVDPAAGSEAWVVDTLTRLDAEPVLVLDTHGHWDHVVENHVWAARGLPVWVGSGDEDWLEAPAPFNPALFGNPRPPPASHRPDPAGRRRPRAGRPAIPHARNAGHSPGCMVAHEATEGHALVGDLVFAQGIGRTDFPRSDPAAMLRSLERTFAEIPGDTLIYPGHGPWSVALTQAEPYARMFM